jgi:hypothetical protein
VDILYIYGFSRNWKCLLECEGEIPVVEAGRIEVAPDPKAAGVEG